MKTTEAETREERIAIAVDAMNGILPGFGVTKDSEGRDVLRFRSIEVSIEHIAERVVDALSP